MAQASSRGRYGQDTAQGPLPQRTADLSQMGRPASDLGPRREGAYSLRMKLLGSGWGRSTCFVAPIVFGLSGCSNVAGEGKRPTDGSGGQTGDGDSTDGQGGDSGDGDGDSTVGDGDGSGGTQQTSGDGDGAGGDQSGTGGKGNDGSG